jgi:predicted nucleic acid-binding protein
MRLVLDACIAVASQRPHEPLYAASRSRVDRILAGADELVVPSTFAIEVASALTRGRVPAGEVRRFVGLLLVNADILTIGPRKADAISSIAMLTRLRAYDAVYVWLAHREEVPLVTADEEILARAAAYCAVERP